MFIPKRGRGENVSIAIQRSPSPRQYQYTCLNARTIQRWRSSKCLETVKTSIHFRMLDFHPSLGLWSKKRFWVDGFTDSRHWWSVPYADWCCPPLLGWAFSNNPLHMPHVQSIAWVVIFHSLVWKKNSSKLHQSSSYVIIYIKVHTKIWLEELPSGSAPRDPEVGWWGLCMGRFFECQHPKKNRGIRGKWCTKWCTKRCVNPIFFWVYHVVLWL